MEEVCPPAFSTFPTRRSESEMRHEVSDGQDFGLSGNGKSPRNESSEFRSMDRDTRRCGPPGYGQRKRTP